MSDALPAPDYGRTLTAKGNPLEMIFSHVDKQLTDIVASVADAIASSHGFPYISKIDVLRKNIVADGMFNYYMLGRGKSIIISSKAANNEFSLLHEIGHLIDNQGLCTIGQFESRNESGKLSAIMHAIENTSCVKNLRNIQRTGKLDIRGKKRKISDDTKKQLDYLLQPEELWARAYSQYVVMKTANNRLLNQLENERNDGIYLTKQWLPDDFKNVIFEIENFLIEQQWSTL